MNCMGLCECREVSHTELCKLIDILSQLISLVLIIKVIVTVVVVYPIVNVLFNCKSWDENKPISRRD